MPQNADIVGGIDYARLVNKFQANTPVIYNLTLTLANTQYSQTLPAGTKKFTIKERNGNPFRLAYITGMVATPLTSYMNILTNQIYWEDHVFLGTITPAVGLTIYFAAPIAGRVIEITCWT